MQNHKKIEVENFDDCNTSFTPNVARRVKNIQFSNINCLLITDLTYRNPKPNLIDVFILCKVKFVYENIANHKMYI